MKKPRIDWFSVWVVLLTLAIILSGAALQCGGFSLDCPALLHR